MHKKWLTVLVLVCMLAAAALPPVATAMQFKPLSCGLSFDSAHDDTECWWRFIWKMWSIPPAGGDATLLIGAYVERRFVGQDVEGVPLAPSGANAGEDRPAETTLREDLTLSPGAHVMVKIFDQSDPSHVLFFFEGTLAELMALQGGQMIVAGPYGVVIRVPLTVPAGNVLWVGRMELTQGNYRAHADLFLCQGVPFPFPFFHII